MAAHRSARHIAAARAARAGFILVMGRAHPYKGLDDLLDAFALLKGRQVRVPHVVIAAVTEDRELSAYQRHLAHRISTERLDATLVTRFTPGLRTLLLHPALAAVVVPSRTEPFGRIPLEAFVAGAARLMVPRCPDGLAAGGERWDRRANAGRRRGR